MDESKQFSYSREDKRPDLSLEQKYVKNKVKELGEILSKNSVIAVAWDSQKSFSYRVFERQRTREISKLEKFKAEWKNENIFDQDGDLVFSGTDSEKERTKKQKEINRYQRFLEREKEELKNIAIADNGENSLKNNEIVYASYINDAFVFSPPKKLVDGKLSEKNKEDSIGNIPIDGGIQSQHRIYDNKFNLIYDSTDPVNFLISDEIDRFIPKIIPEDFDEFSDFELEDKLEEDLVNGSVEDYEEAAKIRDELTSRKVLKTAEKLLNKKQ
ncbi:MAG: hypothetical protein NTZ44_02720 [Candidatus Nomurabacteria bacterium]|nr:hypothetical protein [Candidatus Nomurabacteria bacterium]